MKQIQENYISIGNETGSISLLGATLTAILSLFLLFLVLKMQIEYKEAQYRKESYLCFKYLTTKTESYVSQMTKFNWALRTAYAAKLSVAGTEEAEVIFKNLVLFRNAGHISYVKNLLHNKYCSFSSSRDFVKNQPFKINNLFALETAFDETTKIRAHEWENTVSISPKKIRVSKIFLIKVDFTIEDPFYPNLKYRSKEVGRVDLLSLNH